LPGAEYFLWKKTGMEKERYMRMKRRPEILAPAGSRESLEAGLSAGADAVYTGGSRFGARAYANNLDEQQLLQAIDYAHLHGRKIYLTVNTLLKDREINELYDYLLPYYKQGLDAVIVQDIGVIKYIRKHFPKLSVHVSTQATVVHALGAAFFGRLGVERIVPARELSLSEICEIRERTGLEIECFVHGAMCYCYSGQCLLSSLIGGRSGNRGQCAQPCRLSYSVAAEKSQSLLSLRDLCTIDLLPKLIEAGIDSFKIEGRMKQPDYVYEVTHMYRKYTDLYLEKGMAGYRVSEEDKKRLMKSYERRGYSDGYYMRQNGKEMISFGRPESGKDVDGEKRDDRNYKIKEKIRGKLIISQGKPVKLCLEYNGNEKTSYAQVYGDTVQAALKAPLERERVLKQMQKTGNTEFVFEELDIELEEGAFLPMQSLNMLRRDGILALEEQILSCHRRSPEAEGVRGPVFTANVKKPKLSFEVSVSDAEQLGEVIKAEGIDTVYIEGSAAFDEDMLYLVSDFKRKGRAGERRAYAAMPYIFRQRGISCYENVYKKLVQDYDGVLIRNWESYEWLQEKAYPGRIVSDYNMYVFNQESKEFIRHGTKIEEFTVPVELNLHELKQLGGGIFIAYGHQPVMITANCIRQTVSSCEGKEGTLWLTDRRKKKFAVKNYCKYCYNVIYNSAPLITADMAASIKELHPSGIRLDFSIEDGKTTGEIICMYQKAFLEGKEVKLPEAEYTRGHLKRGVR